MSSTTARPPSAIAIGLQKAVGVTSLSLEEVDCVIVHCASARARGLVPAIRGALLLDPPPPKGARALAAAFQSLAMTKPTMERLIVPPHATRDPLAHFLALGPEALPPDVRGLIAKRMRELRDGDDGQDPPKVTGYTLGVAAQHLAADDQAVECLKTGDYAQACSLVQFPGLKPSTAEAYRSALRHALGVEGARRTPSARRAGEEALSPASGRGTRSLLQVLLTESESRGGPDAESPQAVAAPARHRGLTTLAAMRIPRGLRPCPPHLVTHASVAVKATDLPDEVSEVLREVLLAAYLTGWPPALFEGFGSGLAMVDQDSDWVVLDSSLYPPEVGLRGTPVRVKVCPVLAGWLRAAVGPEGITVPLPGRSRPLRGSDLSRTLAFINQGLRQPVWLADLAGAIWFSGRPDWSSSRLVLATTRWDRTFRRPFHYLGFLPEVDVSRLQERMHQELEHSWTRYSAPLKSKS
ncbi:MAG TPA: hypothetical protein VNI34_00215, partial [Candidatus Nitrosotalea sp.]|nr:hypothetical protein [Candidatus Nitrosotalea sp.]